MRPLPIWLDGVQKAPPSFPEHLDLEIYDADTGEKLNGIIEMEFRAGRTVELLEPVHALIHLDAPATVTVRRRLLVMHPPTGLVWNSDDFAEP